MKISKHLPLLAFFLALSASGGITFTVTDTRGQAVESAFLRLNTAGGPAVVATDADGKTVVADPFGGSVYADVYRPGYYTSSGYLWSGGLVTGPGGRLIRRQPPSAFNIVLKKIRQPVPMRYRSFRGPAPRSESPVGFDLYRMDWVSPHGVGEFPDLLFSFEHEEQEDGSWSSVMEISFLHEKDGIQSFEAPRPFTYPFGSNLPPPHEAPLEGYDPRLRLEKSHEAGTSYQTGVEDPVNYLFRTRTATDEAGRIVQACYGWIQGQIRYETSAENNPRLQFVYYFNPDPAPESRSLESYRLVSLDRKKRPDDRPLRGD
ncbi:MAG: hypothetical protein GVY10_07090 [Verrucomicrobia bacterium]|jgi:hypothetical protein|nr:hypothetical protein [Verrucomicrobiota bacterium]